MVTFARLTLNPSGEAGGFGGGEAGFVAAEGLIDDVVLQTDDAFLKEEAMFGCFTAPQVELTVEKCCFDGVVQGFCQGEGSLAIDELPGVGGGIYRRGDPQIGGDIEQGGNIE